MKAFIFFLVLYVAALVSCSESSAEKTYILDVQADTLILKSGTVSQNVPVVSTEDWTATVEEGCDWCRCEVNNGVTSFLKVEVDENKEIQERWTVIRVTSGNLHTSFKVCQFGAAPAIKPFPAAFRNLSFEPGEIFLQVIANVEVEFSIPDSIHWLVKQKEETGDTAKIWYKTTVNTGLEVRTTQIRIQQKAGGLVQTVPVEQQGRDNSFDPALPEGLPKDVKLKITGGKASSFQPGGEIDKSFDGDMGTLYHSNWTNGGENYFPVTLEYYLSPNDTAMDYLIYYPRTTGPNGLFKDVEIAYKTREAADYISMGTIAFNGASTPRRVDFPEQVKNPAAVRFTVLSGAGDGQGFASCAEMEFYQKAEVDASLTAVFTDQTFSELRPGVTYEQIMAMENEFYRNIAGHLFLGTYPLTERVKEYEAYRDPDWIARRYKISPYNRLDNATGIYVQEGDELVVFCGEAAGKQLSLCVMNWDNGYASTNYMLVEGTNQLKMTSSGLVYILYFDTDPDSAPKVKIHIATGTVNGMFTLNVNTDAEWTGLLSRAASEFIDIQGEYAHLVMPVSSFRNYVTKPSELLKVYDRLVYMEHDLMGLFKYGIPIKNRMFFHSVTREGDYMYATSYRTAYHVNTLSEILNVSKMKSGEAVWGPAHEVGHMHQTRPGLKWVGLTEVTNNIHSLNVQTAFGSRSRLISENMGDGTTRYEKAFTNIIGGEEVHDLDGDVFCKLVPFWQLQLYAVKIAGKPDFYKDMHEKIRNLQDPVGKDTRNGVCQMNFLQLSCEILEVDLTEFFQAWGFLREVDEIIDDYGKERMWVTAAQIQEVKAKMADYTPLTLGGLIYLNDENVGLFQNPQAVKAGTASRNGNQITLTGWENVVAYEVWEGNHLRLVRQRNSFVVPSDADWSQTVVKAVAADGTRTDVVFN